MSKQQKKSKFAKQAFDFNICAIKTKSEMRPVVWQTIFICFVLFYTNKNRWISFVSVI